MHNIRLFLVIVTATLTLLPAMAFAHVAEHGLYNWTSGFMHPLWGADHLLAMIAAGCWLSQQKTANRAPIAAVFALVLVAGITVGVSFTGTTFESGIIATLVVLGALVACSAKLALLPGIIVLAVVGAIHGFVHGTELSVAASGSLSFAAGLLVSSLIVFGLSAASATFAHKNGRALTARIAGLAIMAFGVFAIF